MRVGIVRKGGKGGEKRRQRDKGSKSCYETDEAEADIMDDQEEIEDEDANMNYREPSNQMNDQEDEGEENAQDLLAAAGLEDSDVEDDTAAPSNPGRRRHALSESDDNEPQQRQPQSSPYREISLEMQLKKTSMVGEEADELAEVEAKLCC